MPTSNKAAFIANADPRDLIASERQKRSWMKHSVALLIISQQADQIGLVLPVSATERDAANVRVPPQQHLPACYSVHEVALQLAAQLVTFTVRHDHFQFLGSTRGNVYLNGQKRSYGKWVHWVGLRLKRRNGVFNQTSEEFSEARWYHTNQLLAMGASTMSERKYTMTLQALTAFNTLGVDGQLTRRAKQILTA